MHDVHRSAPDVGHALSIMSNTTNTAKSSPDRGMVYVVLPPRSHAPLTEVLYASLASTASSQAASQNRGSPPPVSRGRSPIRAPEKRHVSPLPRREGSTASHRTVSSDRGDPFHDTDCSSPDCHYCKSNPGENQPTRNVWAKSWKRHTPTHIIKPSGTGQ